MYYVYHLINPNNNTPFYVGYTNNPDRRYTEHISPEYNASLLVSKYIKALMVNDTPPVMKILMETPIKNNALKFEAKKIRQYFSKYTLMNDMHPNEEYPFYFSKKTKQGKINTCGVGGYYCHYINECARCYNLEKEKRIDVIVKNFNNYTYLFKSIIKKDSWNKIYFKMVRSEVKFVRIPQKNDELLVITDVDPCHKKISFNKITAQKAIKELCAESNLFPEYGKRSSSSGWELTPRVALK